DEHVEADDVGVRVPAHAGVVGEVGDAFEHVVHVVAAQRPAPGRVGGVGDGEVEAGRADAGQGEVQDADGEAVGQLVVGHLRVRHLADAAQGAEEGREFRRGADAAGLVVNADGGVDQLDDVVGPGRHDRVGRLAAAG